MSHSRTLLRKLQTAKKGRAHRKIGPKGERNARVRDVSFYAASAFLPARDPRDWRTFAAFGLEASYHVTKGLRINREGAQ